MPHNMKPEPVGFYFGKVGRFLPLLAACCMIVWAACSQSNVNGYVVAFFAAVIVLAVILAAISGKMISSSGMVQTIVAYVVSVGLTGRLFVATTFVITCLLAFATGTSVGTYFVVIPILFPVGVMAGVAPVYMIGAIVSGAAFGDNLGPISDTTIASSATQHAELGMVVKTRTRYSVPAAVGAMILFLAFSKTTDTTIVLEGVKETAIKPVSLLMLVIPIVIITLCLRRKHLVVALSWGIVAGAVVGLLSGIYSVSDFLAFPGGFAVEGIVISAITGTTGTVCMLIGVFALIGVMEAGGVFESVGSLLNRFAKSKKSAEATIVLSAGILSMITGVISVAIVTLGDFCERNW